jgi:hypothetical protein
MHTPYFHAGTVCTYAQFDAAARFLQPKDTEASLYLQSWRPDQWQVHLLQPATQPIIWQDTVDLYVDGEWINPERPAPYLESLVPESVEKGAIDTPWVAHLEQVKEMLSLTITQTAELYGVTRKAVYDWYEGSVPRQAIVDRTDVLLDVLGSIPKNIELTRLKSVWNVPISGSSFRQVFDLNASDSLAYRSALEKKLTQLSTRLIAAKALSKGANTVRPSNTVADFDRYAIANE